MALLMLAHLVRYGEVRAALPRTVKAAAAKAGSAPARDLAALAAPGDGQ